MVIPCIVHGDYTRYRRLLQRRLLVTLPCHGPRSIASRIKRTGSSQGPSPWTPAARAARTPRSKGVLGKGCSKVWKQLEVCECSGAQVSCLLTAVEENVQGPH